MMHFMMRRDLLVIVPAFGATKAGFCGSSGPELIGERAPALELRDWVKFTSTRNIGPCGER
jgi:hypothetical protein